MRYCKQAELYKQVKERQKRLKKESKIMKTLLLTEIGKLDIHNKIFKLYEDENFIHATSSVFCRYKLKKDNRYSLNDNIKTLIKSIESKEL